VTLAYDALPLAQDGEGRVRGPREKKIVGKKRTRRVYKVKKEAEGKNFALVNGEEHGKQNVNETVVKRSEAK